jgi:outer membrane lipoprotein-sorting protein
MKAKSFIILLTIMILSGYLPVNAQDAMEITKNMDRVLYAPKDMKGMNKIVLIDKNGKEETREAYLMQKGTDKRLMRFTSPASQAGIAVLALPDNVMYMYLPAFGKERRISGSVKNQNFAGTDFSYDDMEPKPYADKYTPKLVKADAGTYILEFIPVGQSDYSKIVATVNGEHFYPEVMEYYDRGNTKVKVARYSFNKVGKYWSSSEIEMTDLKKNHITKMQMSDVQYDTGMSDDEFTVRKLIQ